MNQILIDYTPRNEFYNQIADIPNFFNHSANANLFHFEESMKPYPKALNLKILEEIDISHLSVNPGSLEKYFDKIEHLFSRKKYLNRHLDNFRHIMFKSVESGCVSDCVDIISDLVYKLYGSDDYGEYEEYELEDELTTKIEIPPELEAALIGIRDAIAHQDDLYINPKRSFSIEREIKNDLANVAKYLAKLDKAVPGLSDARPSRSIGK